MKTVRHQKRTLIIVLIVVLIIITILVIIAIICRRRRRNKWNTLHSADICDIETVLRYSEQSVSGDDGKINSGYYCHDLELFSNESFVTFTSNQLYFVLELVTDLFSQENYIHIELIRNNQLIQKDSTNIPFQPFAFHSNCFHSRSTVFIRIPNVFICIPTIFIRIPAVWSQRQKQSSDCYSDDDTAINNNY